MGKLCQYCNKREAKIHFTEIKDGKQTEMHICEHCAHEKNLAMAFPSLLSHIVKGGPSLGGGESDAVPSTCPACGMGYAEFKSKGRLGCSTCYEAFAPVLVALLEKVHGASRHSGRAPEHAPEPMEPLGFEPEPEVEPEPEDLSEEEALRAELEEAIASEEYEKAAELRDKIRALKEAGGEP